MTFTATIIKNEGRSGGCYIEFPFDTEKVFGTKGRVPVICFFDGIEYRGSLVRMGGNCHIIGVLKEILAQLGKKPGDMVAVTLLDDNTPREIVAHRALQHLLENDEKLKAGYEKLSYTAKREINRDLESTKKEVTREERIEKIILKLSGIIK